MWLPAVSALLILGPGDLGQQTLRKDEERVVQAVRQRIAVITQGSKETGVAVCIGEDGTFLAHKSVVAFPVIFAKLSNGRLIHLEVKSTDETTQLSLLKASKEQGVHLTPVTVAAEPTSGQKPDIIALTPSGPIRADYVSGERLGVLSANRRTVPLTELKFEAPLSRVAGAPLFTMNGDLIGILNATLPNPGAAQATPSTNAFGGTARGAAPETIGQFGPQGLTVGYAVGPVALQKVVQGFLSERGVVNIAVLGILLKDAKGGGAEIQSVTPKSAAADAGLQAGDVILEIAGQPVRNQIDYAKIMLRQDVGATIDMKIRRGAEVMTVKATPRD